ncbi:MAG: SpoIIE family protein phosphatase [Candidatus Aminicenantes bacterium]|nr:MAG: SpoIIE family protein phosphatase [Candidatus Aminicenantes bacterium]
MPYKILVVEDEPDWESVIRQKFKKQISLKEWEFIFAGNGRQALEKVKEIPGITVVLLDINMPEMDGLTFLNQLDEVDKLTIKVIMVTAYGNMENIRKAMNEGAFDFLIKPIEFKDLEITINKALNQVKIIKAALKSQNELNELNKELEIASRIQESMLPGKASRFPPHKEFDIFAQMIPAKKIGGDFYDFFLVDEDRLAIAVGDVKGKGISAALYMVKACTLLKTTALRFINPGECLLKLHKLLISEKKEDSDCSVTLFYGVLNIKTGMMQYACAGLPAPFIVYADGKVEQLPQVGGITPGYYLEGINIDYEVEKIHLQKGDTIICCTDGVTDAENPGGKQFAGEKQRLLNSLQGANNISLEKITTGLISKIREFVSGAPQTDDITILALRCNLDTKGL